MPINTKKVSGRRQVRYKSLHDLLDDATHLAETDVRTLGNWSQGQIYEHLARSFDSSIDGAGFKLPAPVRWVMSLLMKRKFLYHSLPAGFSAPSQMVPSETSVAQGLESLQRSVARQTEETSRAIHPAFGHIGCSEWNDFHLRHAELHMSFLADANG